MVRFTQVKHIIHDKYNYSAPFLGLADTMLLLSYAVGFLVCGKLGEVMKLTHLTCLGLIGVGGLYLLTAFGFWLDVMSRTLYALLWFAEGPFQSAILLGCAALMINWFPPETRGTVMGIWGASGAVGNIVGEVLAGVLEEELHLEWEWSVVSTSSLVLFAASLLFCFITDSPQAADVTEVKSLVSPLINPDQRTLSDECVKEDPAVQSQPRRLAMMEVMKIPGLIHCSLCYGGLKMLNFGCMMWLPYFFEDTPFHMGMEEAGFLATFYDMGSIIGCMVFGYLSDKVEKRAWVLVLMLGIACPVFAIVPLVEATQKLLLYLLVPIAGATIAGGCNLMLTTVTADLSHNYPESNTAVIGVVSTIATLCAAVGQVIVGQLSLIGWCWVFGWFCSKA